ncbi:MAG: hypothetical protein CM1200mP15_17780 [Dehalococcoidia bacterium]|nr:MAG: hypothetical protein CM1200mP15_17780 [Dehalococcoidia bacterium]
MAGAQFGKVEVEVVYCVPWGYHALPRGGN